MTREQQIAKLEGLLNRINVNRERPRERRVFEATPPPAHTERRPVAERPSIAQAVAERPSIVQVARASAPSIETARASAPSIARPELESISDFELLDDEIIEISGESVPPPAAEAAEVVQAAGAEAEAEVVFDEEEEEPPVSSRRPKIAAETMDEALAGAAEELETGEEHEVPVKTPPPESGPQEAAPVQAPPPAPLPQFHKPARAAQAPAPPPAAASAQPIEPVVTRRAEPPAAEVMSVVGAARTFSPKSFLDLLDASLGLGSD